VINSSVDLLLIQCPAWGVELPPINLALLKAAVIKSGFKCEAWDLNVQSYQQSPKESLHHWDKHSLTTWVNLESFNQEILPLIQDFLRSKANEVSCRKIPLVGMTIVDTTVHSSNFLAEEIKKLNSEICIIAGGPAMSFKECRVRLSQDFDYYLVGEGEEAIVEFLNGFENINTFQKSTIPQGFYSAKEDLHRDLPLRELSSLEEQPKPDFTDFELHPYTESALPMISTRSCLFQCKFCADIHSMGGFRKLSSKQILRDLRQVHRLGYRKVWMNDLLINGILKELVEAFGKFNSEGCRVEWIALATPNNQLKRETLETLASFGLHTLNFGLETGSPKIMRAMGKGFNLRQAEAALQRTRQAGIETQLNVIVGFPGETEEDFEMTLNFLERNHKFISGFTSVNTCIVLPGSELSRRRDFYSIEFPSNMNPSEWFTGTTNTPLIREKRLDRLIQWIQEHKYDIYCCNS
tara:strand:- start:1754 stop:3151 length:1398 start_codon:yes stop_codon:yes gene_type:complete